MDTGVPWREGGGWVGGQQSRTETIQNPTTEYIHEHLLYLSNKGTIYINQHKNNDQFVEQITTMFTKCAFIFKIGSAITKLFILY